MVKMKDIDNIAIGKIPLTIRAEIGSTDLPIEQLMKIGRGAIIEVSKDVDDLVDLKIGDHLIGHAQLEADGDYFTVRVVDMVQDEDETHTFFRV